MGVRLISLLAPAADGEDGLAGDVGSLVGCEEASEVGLLFGLCHSGDHELRCGVVRETLTGNLSDHRGIGGAGAEAVGTDAVLCQLNGDALSHRGDSALARGVRSGVGASAADVDGCGVDDSAFGAVGDECTSRGLSAVEAAEVVVVNDACVFFLSDVDKVLEEVDAGIAEHDVEAAEMVICGLNERVNLSAVRNVTDLAPAVLCAEVFDYFLKKIVVTCADNDLAAVLDEAGRNSAAYAGRTAGDDGHFAYKSVGSCHSD